MEYYFETDDKLERRKYAEFLKSMLENCDKYRREDSEGAYVIAIDSPWGTGKTRFAKMLRNYLEDRKKEMRDDSLPGENASLNAIYYNSWETDFSDDALLPLVHSILESPEMELKRFDTEGKKTLRKFKKVAIDVAKIAGYTILHNVCGETVTQMAKAAEAAASETEKDPIIKYKERLDLLKNFRSILQDVITQTRQKKLVIIIDELDRCRPTFAIQTLELVKHLFAVKGLNFIFALDIKQLSCSVKTIYGQEMDATGYLCRFFDYISQLPMLDKRKIIEDKIVSLENAGLFSQVTPLNLNNSVAVEISEFILNIAVHDNLSIREILSLLSHYEIMVVTFLKEYEAEIPFLIYFFLLFLKLRHRDVYNTILTNVKYTGNWEKYLRDQLELIIDEQVIMQKLVFLNNKRKIKDVNFNIVESNIVNYESKRATLVITAIEKSSTFNRKFFLVRCLEMIEGHYISRTYTYESTYCCDQVLFYKDLIEWERIKDLTLPEYYYQCLEMFNFSLPADDIESKA